MALRIPIQVVAALIGKSINFVRWGLQQKRLPYGYAVESEVSNKKRYSYYINPIALSEETGKSLKELEALSNAYRAKEKESRVRRKREREMGIVSMRRYRKKGERYESIV